MVPPHVGVGMDPKYKSRAGHPLSEEDMRFAHRLARISSTARYVRPTGMIMKSSCGAALNIENPIAGIHAEPGISSTDQPALLNSEAPITGIHIHPGNRQLDKHPEW